MSKQSERSHDPKPFDSRRTKPVTLVTPRNPAPAPPAPSATGEDESTESPSS